MAVAAVVCSFAPIFPYSMYCCCDLLLLLLLTATASPQCACVFGGILSHYSMFNRTFNLFHSFESNSLSLYLESHFYLIFTFYHSNSSRTYLQFVRRVFFCFVCATISGNLFYMNELCMAWQKLLGIITVNKKREMRSNIFA